MSLAYQVIGQTYHGSIRKIGLEDGLSHYKVLSLLAETDGMWIGTEDGLDFFDGYHWQYWPGESGTLTEKNISFLEKDQAGFLWVFHARDFKDRSTITSIDLITPERDSVFQLTGSSYLSPPFLPSDIQHFFVDEEDRLYFFAKQQLWCYTKAEQFQPISLPPGFTPHDIFADGSYIGRLDEKLVLLTAGGEVRQTLDYPLQNCAYDFLGDAEQFWIFQLDGPCKIYRRVEGTDEYQSELVSLPELSYVFPALLCYNAQEHEIWIKNGEYVYLLDAENNLKYHYPKPARQIILDDAGNYWFGKNQINILQLQPKRFERLLWNKGKKGPARIRCRGIIEKDGQLLVATYRGVRRINLADHQLNTPARYDTLGFSFLKDRQEQLWLGRRDVLKLDTSATVVEERYQANRTRIWSLFEDRNGVIWLGTQRGIAFLRDGEVQDFVDYNGYQALKDALVLFFYEDQDGTIWIGSTEGLFQLDLEQGIVAAYGKNQSDAHYLPSGNFQHMHQDQDGDYWLATKDAGLLRWDKANATFQQFDKSWGLPTDNIYCVYEDDYAHLWMSSFEGIVRFSKKTGRVQTFFEEDGISENEFNRISHYMASDGHLYFGSQNGVTAFHPRNFLQDSLHASSFGFAIKHISVVDEDIWNDYWADGSPINLEQLPPDTKIINLEIEGANVFWANQVSLNYTLTRLTPNDSIIVREGEHPDSRIELLDLQPGTYELRVGAIRKNGKQVGDDFFVSIHIRQPIYHHPAFWVVLLLLIATSIWGFLRWRTAHLRRQKIKLEALVEKRTQEVLEKQQTIANQAEIIQSMRSLLNQQDEAWLKQFQDIVDQRLADPTFYLPDVIEEMNISRTVFYEKVKALTDMTPNQYIVELRLTKAKSLLDKGKAMTVKEVAQAVGIKDPKYFSRRFKERFGVLPSTFFKQVRN
ncbi:MAG: two-component regulator propeller domain-containing protein [Bacteroidota bacterium]